MQALKNLKPATGGKISGPGTSTSDSIPAQITETGEPLQVSNQERILSAKQEALLQQIAKLLGFESVDALLEAGTGEPVGPTIKGGKKAAVNGMPPESKDLTNPPDAGTKQTAGFMRSFNSATDNPDNVVAARAADNASLADGAKKAFAGTLAAIQGGGDDAEAAAKAGNYGAAIGHVGRGVLAGLVGLGDDTARSLKIALDPAANALKTFVTGDSTPASPVTTTPATTTPATTTTPAVGSPAATSTDLAGPPAPDAKTSNYLAGNNLKSFEDKGGGILRQVGTDGSISFTNVGTGAVADPNKAAPVANSFNMAEGNAALARANAIRQSMIDSQVPQGRGAYLVNGGGLGKERERLLATVLTPHKGAMNGQLTANQINAARGILSDAQSEQLKGAEIAQRGDEAAQRSAQEAARLAQGLPAMEGQQLQNEQGRLLATLQKKAVEGDEKALATWQAINSKEKTPRYTTHVVPGALGEPATLVQTGPDGQLTMAGTGGEITKQYAERAAKQPNGNVQTFKDAASVDAAKAAGTLKAGDVIQVNGRMAVVK